VQSLGHRRRLLDAVDLDSALDQRDRDPPGADRELQCSPVAGERSQE
jgi:hypothetical protein